MNQVFQRGVTRARFNYSVDSDRMQISIVDLNEGAMTVTNDMENVIDYIARNEQIDPCKYLILYSDSEGDIDGWNARTHEFYFVGAPSFDEGFRNMKIELAN